MAEPPKIIVGISGASGTVYGIRILDMLGSMGIETHLVLSHAGAVTLTHETAFSRSDVVAKAHTAYKIDDIAAPIASGSFQTGGMIVAPCSIHTMSAIATGVTANLLTRAADVTLKERRPLVLMVRETPLHLGHLRTLTALAEMGAIILPPVPAFYTVPGSIDDIIDQAAARALDLVGHPWPHTRRWGEKDGHL